jgi:undecaprenyl-diphosphatase
LVVALNGATSSPIVAFAAACLSSPWMIPIVCGPLAIVLWRRRDWRRILTIACVMGASDLAVARVVKPLVDRERPCRAIPNLVRSASCGPGRSFPSGHAAVAFAFLVTAAPSIPWGWAILGPLAALVAGSRVFLGVHYPSDVGGGAALGAAIGALGLLAQRRLTVASPARPKAASSP